MDVAEVVSRRVEREGQVWTEIELNRPDKGNALTLEMIERLGEIAGEIAGDRETRAVVIRGRGRFFCTGGDIEAWGALTPHEMAQRWILPGIEAFERLAALPVPVIAAISGHALGGGLELALAADLRIALGTAKLGMPEVTLNMIAGWMGVRRLAETVGVARAREMALLGAPVTAAQALDWGLVNAIASSAEDLEQQLAGWLTRICANGPGAMGLVKGILGGMHADVRHEHAAAAGLAAATEDSREGVRAFIEKRRPVYRNR